MVSACAARTAGQTREQLRTAHEMLAPIGIEAFAERARKEPFTAPWVDPATRWVAQ
jgi:hypothetical protein